MNAWVICFLSFFPQCQVSKTSQTWILQVINQQMFIKYVEDFLSNRMAWQKVSFRKIDLGAMCIIGVTNPEKGGRGYIVETGRKKKCSKASGIVN